MAKKVQAMVKLQIQAGKATPAPPVGTALGPHGVVLLADKLPRHRVLTRAAADDQNLHGGVWAQFVCNSPGCGRQRGCYFVDVALGCA